MTDEERLKEYIKYVDELYFDGRSFDYAISKAKYELYRKTTYKKKVGFRKDRKLQFIYALIFLKDKKMLKVDAIESCMGAIRAGLLDNFEIQVV